MTKDIWPNGFAIYGDCDYPLHTHDTSGKIHVEADAPSTFTLGQLFAIWGQPLSYSNIAGIIGSPVVVYINDGTNLPTLYGRFGRHRAHLTARNYHPNRQSAHANSNVFLGRALILATDGHG